MEFLTVLDELVRIDTDVFLFFNQMHCPYFDYFMSAFSGKLVWIPLYASLLYLLFKNFNWKVTLMSVIGIALLIVITDQSVSSLIRPEVCRLRPSNLDNPISDLVHIVNGRRGGSYGFPSCHASNTFGLAFFLMFLFRNRKLTAFFLTWAVFTCYSRIYLGVHYPGDTLAGMLVGLVAAALVYGVMRRFCGLPRKEHIDQAYVPIAVGGLTVVCFFIYSGIMLWVM